MCRETRVDRRLSVQPDILEARPVVGTVDHLGHPLHPRLVADRGAWVEETTPTRFMNEVLPTISQEKRVPIKEPSE